MVAVMSDLVGAPSREEVQLGRRTIVHHLTSDGALSVWGFVKQRDSRYPLLHRITRHEYGPQAEFELDHQGQAALLGEIDSLMQEIRDGRESTRAGGALEDLARELAAAGPGLSKVSLSPLAAQVTLKRVRDFVLEVVKRGWMLYGVGD